MININWSFVVCLFVLTVYWYYKLTFVDRKLNHLLFRHMKQKMAIINIDFFNFTCDEYICISAFFFLLFLPLPKKKSDLSLIYLVVVVVGQSCEFDSFSSIFFLLTFNSSYFLFVCFYWSKMPYHMPDCLINYSKYFFRLFCFFFRFGLNFNRKGFNDFWSRWWWFMEGRRLSYNFAALDVYLWKCVCVKMIEEEEKMFE